MIVDTELGHHKGAFKSTICCVSRNTDEEEFLSEVVLGEEKSPPSPPLFCEVGSTRKVWTFLPLVVVSGSPAGVLPVQGALLYDIHQGERGMQTFEFIRGAQLNFDRGSMQKTCQALAGFDVVDRPVRSSLATTD